MTYNEEVSDLARTVQRPASGDDVGGAKEPEVGLLNGRPVDQQTRAGKGASDPTDPSESYVRSSRWKIAYMGLFYGLMSYLLRVNISIALPFMVKSTSSRAITSMLTSHVENDTYAARDNASMTNVSVQNFETGFIGPDPDQCPKIGTSLSESLNAEFEWSKQSQGLVLSAFYYGYMWQFLFGWVAGKYGGKHIITAAMTVSSLITLLTPVLARYSVYTVIAARAVLGLISGATIPAWYKLLSQWSLPYERSRFTAICWFGQILGTVIGLFSSGILCAHGFDNGWGSVFYVDGIVGVIFVLLWLYIVYDSPDLHPRITPAELKLLTSLSRGTNTAWKKNASVPWKQMLTSRAVWVIFFTHVMDCVVFYMVLTCLPLYMKEVLKFDIQSNGAYSSLPFISMCAGLVMAGLLGDHVISRHWASTTVTRKLAQVIGNMGMAVFILVPGFLTCDQRMGVIVCLCLCLTFEALGIGAGFPCSAVDIAPRYASIIFGISNSIATIAGIVTPVIVGELTTNDSAAEWRAVFCFAAGSAAIGALVFGLFSSSELAPWADVDLASTELEVYREPTGDFVVKTVDTGDADGDTAEHV